MKADAEEGADRCKYNRQQQDPQSRKMLRKTVSQLVKVRNRRNLIELRQGTKSSGQGGCRKRGNDTGNQSRVMDDADTDDFHGEDSGCERSSEDR